MTDAHQAALWLMLLALGLLFCVVIHRLGVPATHIRDLLHVGAGVWPLGWPFWHRAEVPICIAVGATAGLALVPLLAPRWRAVRRLQQSVCGEDERWSGLVLYAASFALLTGAGLFRGPFPAAAALFALALGDGIGGAAGRRFGRHFFSAPGGKRKSLEGSSVVAGLSMIGALLAGCYFRVEVSAVAIALVGLAAAIAEAAAPRAMDNLLVPASVYLVAGWLT